MLSRIFGDFSLRFLDYVTKMIGKSCKAVSSKTKLINNYKNSFLYLLLYLYFH